MGGGGEIGEGSLSQLGRLNKFLTNLQISPKEKELKTRSANYQQ